MIGEDKSKNRAYQIENYDLAAKGKQTNMIIELYDDKVTYYVKKWV